MVQRKRDIFLALVAGDPDLDVAASAVDVLDARVQAEAILPACLRESPPLRATDPSALSFQKERSVFEGDRAERVAPSALRREGREAFSSST